MTSPSATTGSQLTFPSNSTSAGSTGPDTPLCSGDVGRIRQGWRALELYRRALARDSAFAEAWAGLANVYVLIPTSPNVSGLATELAAGVGTEASGAADGER